MEKSRQYFEQVIRLLTKTAGTQSDAIARAVDILADTLEKGGTLFTFGTGHSHMLAEEVFYRAGGLVKVYPILDEPLMLHINASRSSHLERLSGYARTLLEDGVPLKEGDVLFIFSNSGRNAVPVEMALEAKIRGLSVLCITNMTHSKAVVSRHPSGKKLYEVCDLVIDNGGVVGDACVDIGGRLCGPTSSVIGTAILQAIVCGVVEKMQQDGVPPEVFSSSNVDGGDAVNEAYIEKYRKEIRML